MARIEGEFSALVVPRDPSLGQVQFNVPVESSIEGPNLRIAGGNRSDTLFPLNQIAHIDVSTYDAALTTLASVLIGLAATGAILSVTLAVVF